MSRESITVALKALLATATGVAASSRHFDNYDEVAPGDYPYLILLQDRETIDPAMQQMGGRPAIHRLQFKVLLYALGDGTEDTVPATALNGMIDAIEAALMPVGAPQRQTLGIANVQWAVINGPIEYDGGAYGNYGIAVIPVEVAYS